MSACFAHVFLFLSTPSARRATPAPSSPLRGLAGISIHALREEGDLTILTYMYFIQRISIHALREEGDRVVLTMREFTAISIHALREEGDHHRAAGTGSRYRISIHALREEGDLHEPPPQAVPSQFLSTPSARRATEWRGRLYRKARYFYPRPPRGGRRSQNVILCICRTFLSTPSARRATTAVGYRLKVIDISIHALREEGDF